MENVLSTFFFSFPIVESVFLYLSGAAGLILASYTHTLSLIGVLELSGGASAPPSNSSKHHRAVLSANTFFLYNTFFQIFVN